MHGGRFFVRRIFKIWPLFYTAFLVELAYFILKHQPPPGSHILPELLFVQNYFPGFMMVTWSLGIEEQFYIVVALILPLTAHFQKVKWIIPGCALVMAISLSWRIIHYFSFRHFQPYTHHFPLQFRADSLAAGMVISWYYHFHTEKFRKWVAKNAVALFLASLVFLLPAFILSYTDRWIFTVGFTSIWLGYSGIVILLIFLPAVNSFWYSVFNKNKLMLVMAWVGFYSYAIYLFHLFVGPGVLSNFQRYIWPQPPLFIRFLVFLAGDVLFGFFISSIIEQPLLRWRDRRFPPKEKRAEFGAQNLPQHVERQFS